MTGPSGLSQVAILKGVTIPFDELPRNSVALDGYVQGPFVDLPLNRYSFDHHGGCVRHATLSTCEMTLDALRVGFSAAGLSIYINDLDADTVLAVWLLQTPAAARVERVAVAVRAVGRIDALGPAAGNTEREAALRWALAPLTQPDELRLQSEAEWRGVLDQCIERLNHWLDAGAPLQAESMRVAEAPEPTFEVLYDGEVWQLLKSDGGVGAFAAAYRRGVFAAVVARPLADGSIEYTVGKASEFVRHFDVPTVLAALAAAELASHRDQRADCNWGGGSTIGGSPRNPDGSASRLIPAQVAAVVEEALRL